MFGKLFVRFGFVGSFLLLLAGCGSGDSALCQLDCKVEEKPTISAYVITLEPYNADGTPFNNQTGALVFGVPMRVVATLKDANGVVQPAQIIKFTVSDPAIATLTSSGSLLTDSAGSGVISVNAASPSASGAVKLTATASVGSGVAVAEATQELSFRINEQSVNTNPGKPAFLKFISVAPNRLFVSGGSLGSANAAEESVVTFKVLDATSAPVPGASVIFDVTKRNGGILTNGLGVPVKVKADSLGNASVTVRSGIEPMSINVLASAVIEESPLILTKEQWSDEQIIISGKKPDQFKFFMMWEAGATCGKLVARTYPCKLTIFVGDEKGNPVADGTVVNMVSDTGLVVAEKQAGQPSGACLTVNSQCVAEYTGKGGIDLGMHHVIAYAVGNFILSPKGYPSAPITYDGSWVDVGGFVTQGGNVVVSNVGGDADYYVRNCLSDVGSALAMSMNTCKPYF